jgi:ABC-2 type transport system permease protein
VHQTSQKYSKHWKKEYERSTPCIYRGLSSRTETAKKIAASYYVGMTGAFAPTALIDNDNGYYSKMFVENLENAHQAFNLKFMDEKSALNAIGQGKLVAIITIPKGFSDSIALGKTVPINVVVDNIDTDMTADIQRALPSAITTFAKVLKSPDIHVQTAETDLIDHDTGFIPYLVVSALALSALIISGILGAITVAREFESKTFEVIRVSPTNPVIPILGRVLATNIVSVFALLLAVSIVIWGHGIIPSHPVELTLVLLLCIVVFGWIGAALGAALKKTLPSVSLIFGISLPLYLFSGTYEPQRFDGNLTWTIAHFTPLYYVVGILEHSVLDLKVTPESVGVNFLIVAGWGILALGVMYHFIQRTTTSLLTVSPAISTGELESPSRSLKARLSGQNPILNRLKATSRASARGSISWHQWRRSKLYKSFRWVEDIWIITKLDLLMWRRTPLAVASALIPPIGMALILVALSLAVVQQPVALVVLGNGQYSQKMQEIIQSDTDAYVNYDFSPDLKPTDEQTAKNLLDSQQIVAIITIPSDFDEKVENRTAKVDLLLNNVDIDFADDIRRSVDRSVAHFDAPILSSNDAEEAGQSFDLSQQNPYRIMIDEHDLRETNVEWLTPLQKREDNFHPN